MCRDTGMFTNRNKDLTPKSGLLSGIFILEQKLLGIQKGLIYFFARTEVIIGIPWSSSGWLWIIMLKLTV